MKTSTFSKIEFWLFTVFALALAFLGFVQVAEASVTQTDFSTLSQGAYSNPAQTLGTEVQGTFESLEIKYQNIVGVCGYFLRILESTSTPTSITDGTYVQSTGSKNCASSSGDTWLASDFASTPTFTLGRFYTLVFYQLDRYMYGAPTSTNPYANGQFTFDTSTPFLQDDNGISDAYFVLEGGYGEDPEVSLVYPTATTTLIADFTNWVVQNNNPDITGYTRQELGVSYWQNTTSSTEYADFMDYSPFVSASPTPIRKSQLLWYAPLATTTTWIARPWNIVFTSSTATTHWGNSVTFYVNNITGTISLAPEEAGNAYPNPAFGIGAVDCSAYDDTTFFSSSTIASIGCQIESAVTNIINAVIVPKGTGLAFFQEAWSDLKSTFPFVLFYQYTTAVEEAVTEAETNTNDYTLKLELPPFDEWTLLSSSTLEQAFGTTTKARIFTTIETVLWIATGITMIAIIAL